MQTRLVFSSHTFAILLMLTCNHTLTLLQYSLSSSFSHLLMLYIPSMLFESLPPSSQPHPTLSLLTRICTLIRRDWEPRLIKLEVQVVIQTVDHSNYS